MGYSPWLGAITAAFEILAAIWIFRLPGRNSLLIPLGITQLLLAGYQIFEVLICTGPTSRQLVLSRMAFLDITWLPPLSLLLLCRVMPIPPHWLKRFTQSMLILGGVFSFWIIVDTRFVTGTICHFMYSKYQHIQPYFHFYGAFYEISQMSMIFIPAVMLAKVDDPEVRAHLSDLLVGALLFIVPSIFLAAVLPSLFETALPSLMCHFALFYAVFLVRVARRETQRSAATVPELVTA